MNPIKQLLQEHVEIMAQIADLRMAARDLTIRGDAALPESLPVLRRIGHMMETQLALHARKEDEALFPAIEAALGADGSPTIPMRQEHKDIHAQGELMRQTLRELNEVQHPAIESGGARLRSLAADGDSAASLRATAEEIIDLLDAHFGKEEQMLFPMTESLLDEGTLNAVGAKMEAMH
ncbi:MAG TPA: hemerythrin domain-containing protein [Anaerolineae bacterium]|nr:hemerythrin domain-containing protein [Anaerolineae bacterium]